jgi:hypothetical protein
VTGSPDDRLEQDPEVGMGLADQDPCHGSSVGLTGREVASGPV